MTHSADGDWFWTGSDWVAARSPDRAWWWDGARWVPSGPTLPVPFQYQPTLWTRRLQLLVVGLTVAGILVLVFTFPALMNQVFEQAMSQSLANQPGLTPADAAQVRQTMNGIITASVVIAAVLSVILYGLLFFGVWKLWRWVFWYYLVVGFFAVLAIPQDIAYALGAGPYRLPLWFVVPSVVQALAWLALSIWMLVLYRRVGTWARRRVPVGSPVANFP